MGELIKDLSPDEKKQLIVNSDLGKRSLKPAPVGLISSLAYPEELKRKLSELSTGALLNELNMDWMSQQFIAPHCFNLLLQGMSFEQRLTFINPDLFTSAIAYPESFAFLLSLFTPTQKMFLIDARLIEEIVHSYQIKALEILINHLSSAEYTQEQKLMLFEKSFILSKVIRNRQFLVFVLKALTRDEKFSLLNTALLSRALSLENSELLQILLQDITVAQKFELLTPELINNAIKNTESLKILIADLTKQQKLKIAPEFILGSLITNPKGAEMFCANFTEPELRQLVPKRRESKYKILRYLISYNRPDLLRCVLDEMTPQEKKNFITSPTEAYKSTILFDLLKKPELFTLFLSQLDPMTKYNTLIYENEQGGSIFQGIMENRELVLMLLQGLENKIKVSVSKFL